MRLSIKEAADYSGKATSTVHRWMTVGIHKSFMDAPIRLACDTSGGELTTTEQDIEDFHRRINAAYAAHYGWDQ